MDMIKNEIWKTIEGYEGRYEVSNLGRVRSIIRTNNLFSTFSSKSNKNKRLKNKKSNGIVLVVPDINYIQRYGYHRVSLVDNEGNKKHHTVHRLVAKAFIPNPNNYPIINHKDECGCNNKVENLEWCTYKYNSNYGTAQQRRNETRIKNIEIRSGGRKVELF